jgi:branched-chain amino acid transport system ATP-binding protein
MLRLDAVRLSYGQVQAVRGVSLTIETGEIVTLIGANGAGKSSILKAISGIHPISEGLITFDDVEIHRLPGHQIVRQGISHCPEGRRIFYDLTVRENLQMGGYVLSRIESEQRMEQVLELFPRLRERISQSGGTLSGGEQQMLAIGRALMCGPKLLMLDEPSLGLAPLMVESIFEAIMGLNRSGLTVLLVEQNAAFALEVSHRGYVLETGTVTLQGESASLRRDKRVIESYLGG